jgi:hypothetical protein
MINLWKSIYVQAKCVRAVYVSVSDAPQSRWVVTVEYGGNEDFFYSDRMSMEEADRLAAEIVEKINNNHA